MTDIVIVRPRVSSFYKRALPFAALLTVSEIAAMWSHRGVGWGKVAVIVGALVLAMTVGVGTILYIAHRKKWVTISEQGLQAPDYHGIQRNCTWDAILDAEAIPGERGGYKVNVNVRHLPVTLFIPSEVVEQRALLPAIMQHVPRDHPLATALREAGA